jgi:hypothetical protein
MTYSPKSFLLPALLFASVNVASVSAAHSQEFMSQEELLAAIPGHTIRAKSNDGTSWYQVYSTGKKKGTIEGMFGDQPIKSKWSVKGDKWCEDWGDGKACWDVERVDSNSLRMYENGKPKKHLWKLE